MSGIDGSAGALEPFADGYQVGLRSSGIGRARSSISCESFGNSAAGWCPQASSRASSTCR
jgi:hypothetical protein